MKKIISILLVFVLCLSCVTAFAEKDDFGRTYGADNINNKPGDLIVGFLGDSIMEGSGASPYTNRYTTKVINQFFKANYPNKNIIELNASIGGSESGYGLLRMRKDLGLDSENTPDVVFVGFVENDAWSKGMVLSQRIEAIVRQLLALPKIPAIVFVYSTSENTVNNGKVLGTDKCIENAIDANHVIAQRYGIYEIDLNDYVWGRVKNEGFDWQAVFGADRKHPNNAGYQLYADRITEVLNRDKDEAFKKLDPATEPYGDYVYGEVEEVFVESSDIKLTGDWKKKSYRPVDISSNGSHAERFFREGYMYTDNAAGAKIEYEFTGRGIGINYLRTKNNANLKYTIYNEKGSAVKSGTYEMYWKTDTGRCCGGMLATDLPYGKYKFVAEGVLNQKSVDDNKIDANTGGTGLQLNIAYLAVEKAMPVIYPSASDVKISKTILGSMAVGSYKYSCKMYTEGDSKEAFYISDSENGSYTKLAAGNGYKLREEDVGKYIKFGVTPVNSNGDVGLTVYSEASLVVKPTGRIAFAKPISLTVNGADADKPGVGKNIYSGAVKNTGEHAAIISFVAATYKKDGSYKMMTKNSGLVTKTVLPGATEDFTVEIDAEESDSEICFITYSADSMEPVTKALEKFEFVDVVESDGISISVFRINSFK